MNRITPGSAETTSERRWTAGARLVLALGLAFALTVLVSTVAILRLPGDGWQIPYNSAAEEAQLSHFAGDWDTPLQPGDHVISMDGVSMERNEYDPPLSPPEGWGAGDVAHYTVLRAGQSISLDVPLHVLDLGGLLRAFGYTLRGSPEIWSWLLIGLLVFFLRPGSRAAQLFFLASLALIVEVKLGWAGTTLSANFAPLLLYYLFRFTAFFWGYLFFPAIILLALSFPQRIFPLTRWPYGVPVLLFGLTLALSFFTFSTATDLYADIVLIAQAVLLILAFGAALWNTRRMKNDPVARAQALWVGFGFIVSVASQLPFYLLSYFGLGSDFAGLAYSLTLLALPISLGIAITRYHLFDIQVVIRRTLQYTLLTALLALVYFGGVVLLQALLRALTGAESELVVVAATLATAALFQPLRKRVQNFIDRRFYRRQYDVETALAAFLAAARSQTDPQLLAQDLIRVTQSTLEPESIQLWLKK